MRAQEQTSQKITIKVFAIVMTIGVLLCALGISVIAAWQIPETFGKHHHFIILMAYNTAICLILAGISLFALLYNQLLIVRLFAGVIAIVSVLTLVELFGKIALNINFWFIENTYPGNETHGLMSPTTALCLFLLSTSLMLLTLLRKSVVIAIVFLNLITIAIAIIAIFGHGSGIVTAFIWLGIKMAPHSAVAISFFSLAAIIFVHEVAVEAFNQLNFFNRIAIGFGFMSLLVIAIGSVAFMQIHTVSAISHQLYVNPLQINNAAFRIKSEINQINSQLKSLVIESEPAPYQKIQEQLDAAEQRINQDVKLIRETEPTIGPILDNFSIGFNTWKKYTLESCTILSHREFDAYLSRTAFGGQEQVLAMGKILDEINLRAQQHIFELNKVVENTEKDAKNLVAIIVLGFLVLGATVAGLITRSLTSQLQKIRQAMLAVSTESSNYHIPFLHHPEEIGDMARALAVFQENFSARKELETRLRQVIESMPNGIIMVNNLGIIEIVNAQAEKIFGYDRTELIGNPVERLLPHHIAQTHPHHRADFFNNPSPRTMGAGRELFGLRSDGTEIPVEIGLAPVDSKEGMKVLASIVDITERRNATMALNESRERLELTTRINQIGLWEYIVEEKKLVWNDAMFEIYGRNKNLFTNDYTAWTQCIHPDDASATEKLFNESIATLTPFFSKFRIIQPDGNIKYLHAKAKIEHQVGTQKLRMLGTNIDITREEMALAKVHNLEALRSAIVEYSDDAIISKTPEGVITSWNLGAQNMFGYSAEEALGKPIKDLLFPADLIHQEEFLLAQVREGAEIKHFETVRLCKNGELINVSITLSPIKDALGNIVGISAITRDTTATIQAANLLSKRKLELELINEELERSNKELETFAYVASHDLKSPLRGIAQLSTWIEEDLDSNEHEAVKGHTELLRNRIKRMEKLLDDLLIFYRAGKTEGALTSVDLNQMIKEVFEIQNNKPGLLLLINNTLPTLLTFSTPLELIIRNLFSNAIKHHDRQEGLIQVSSQIINDNYIEISVSDDGPGIPEKFHQRIFGMFQTLKPRDELEGSGMGLALIKKIVEGYGGYVKLKSEGRGACFTFSWPLTIRKRQDND